MTSPSYSTVATGAELIQQLLDITQGGYQANLGVRNYTIDVTGDLYLTTKSLPAVYLAPGSTLTIEGNGHSISGQDVLTGLNFQSGPVTVRNLALTHMHAQGGAGLIGAGGGAGLGGALFVGSAGTVTLENVDFGDNSATGGKGA